MVISKKNKYSKAKLYAVFSRGAPRQLPHSPHPISTAEYGNPRLCPISSPCLVIEGSAASDWQGLNCVKSFSGPQKITSRATWPRFGPSCSRLYSSASDCFFFIFLSEFSRKNSQVNQKRSKANFSMQMKNMTVTELKKLIGVLFLIKVYKSNHKKFFLLWSLTDGRSIFNKIISCNEFQEIIRVVRFDDAEPRLPAFRS